MNNKNDDLLGISEVARRLGLSRQRVHILVVAGRFPNARRLHYKGPWYIPESDVTNFKKERALNDDEE